MAQLPPLTQQAPAIVRQARGDLTQLQAAAKLGVDPQTWSRWERGENLPDLRTLERITTVFGLTIGLR